MQPSRTSGVAVASLVCGLLLCIPFLTGLLAIILGLVGISGTKNPAVRGRGMAIAGLILGILSLIGWGSAAGKFATYMQSTGAERTFAKTYLNDLLAGNISNNVANSTDQITSDQLQQLQQQTTAWGALQSVFIIPVPQQKNGFYNCPVVGQCQFATGQHQFQMTLVKGDKGQLLASTFKWTQ
jgi:hypothetical protein